MAGMPGRPGPKGEDVNNFNVKNLFCFNHD